MADRPTIFQNLGRMLFGGNTISPEITRFPNTMDIDPSTTILYSTRDKDDYERKLNQYKQQKLLSYQWIKAGIDNSLESLQGYTAVKLMYRDADLMCSMPEIDSAIDILSEESCALTSEGKMLNIYSRSKRVKAILEDLFMNRLNIHVMLPMVCHAMVKYGNEFMLLNIDQNNGVMGWMELPVYEIDRVENGYSTSYTNGGASIDRIEDLKPQKPRFVWVGHNNGTPFEHWQIAHFRLLKDSFFLPYRSKPLTQSKKVLENVVNDGRCNAYLSS